MSRAFTSTTELHKKVYNFLDRVDPELLSRFVWSIGLVTSSTTSVNAGWEGALRTRVPLESGAPSSSRRPRRWWRST
jgi:hypothetical protein